jgi:uncharacterized membrane protein
MIDARNTWIAASLSALLLAGCAQPDFEPRRTYHALGGQPGWLLSIGHARTEFVGGHDATRIIIATPIAQPTAYGTFYGGHRLAVTISHQPCHDRQSGDAFTDTVLVVADQQSYQGCGGSRLPLLDR